MSPARIPAGPHDPGSSPRPATDTFAHAVRDLEHIVDTTRTTGDRKGYFAAMYSRVTLAVQQRTASGTFDDAARMERFVARFARRYTDAFWARAAGQPTTRSWALAFDAAGQSGPLVLQHLALGMNAHINLDLGIVAAELARPGPVETLAGDFGAINDVLAHLVDRCQDALVAASPALGLVDQLLDRHDENLARFSLRVARDGAWRFAQQLADAGDADWPMVIAQRDTAVADVGARLLTRAGPADSVRRILRLTEWRTVEAVIDLLASVDVD